jgi:selenocysteine lyase/cysteine desulfurase
MICGYSAPQSFLEAEKMIIHQETLARSIPDPSTTTRRNFLLGVGAAGGLSLGSSVRSDAASAANTTSTSFQPNDWASVRAQFRLSPQYVHLSSFYVASHPAPVRAAVERYRKALDENPCGYLERHMFEHDEDMLWRSVCAAGASYIGGKPEEIALTGSTTAGLALLYNGLRLRSGQEILTTTHDHYVHHEAVRLAAAKWGANCRKVALYDAGESASADQLVSRLSAAVRPNTRAIGITWVHSSTGVRLPIRQIAEALVQINRDRDQADRALLIVDGVHGFGVVDDSVAELGCDFFATGTHKWIFAPRGTGLIWARADNWAAVEPTIPSMMAMDSVFRAWEDGHPPQGPTQACRVSPGGFAAFEHQWATVEAFRFHEQIGRKRIADRIAALNGQIKEGLAAMKHVTLHTPRDSALSAGINCFEVRGIKPEDVVGRLREKRVIASTSPYKVTYARLAAGIMNTPEEVDAALEAVKSLA